MSASVRRIRPLLFFPTTRIAQEDRGKARKVHPPVGGIARWLVRADVTLPDRAAQPGRVIATSFDMSRLTKLQQQNAYRWETIVRGWQGERNKCPKGRRSKAMDKYLLRIASTFGAISRSSLYRRTKEYEKSGIVALVDGRAMAGLQRASAATTADEPNNSPSATPDPQHAGSEPAAALAA